MKLFPVDTFKIKSNLSKDEAIQKLAASIKPVKALRISFLEKNNETIFQGEIIGDTFSLINGMPLPRILPRIKGKIYPEGSGSSIDVVIRPEFFAMMICVIFIFFFGFLIVFHSVFMVYHRTFSIMPLIFLLFPGFAYFITVVSFKHESNYAQKELVKIFEGEITEDNFTENIFTENISWIYQ